MTISKSKQKTNIVKSRSKKIQTTLITSGSVSPRVRNSKRSLTGTGTPRKSAHTKTLTKVSLAKTRAKRVRIGKDLWLAQCLKLVESYLRQPAFEPFYDPVDVKEFFDYSEVVEYPMDLSTLKNKILNTDYKILDQFIVDFEMIWINCRMYNDPINDESIINLSRELEEKFKVDFKNIVDRFGSMRCKGKYEVFRSNTCVGGFLSDCEDQLTQYLPPHPHP